MNEKTWKHTYNLQIVNSNQKIAGELLNLVYCMYNYIASIVAVSIFNLQLPPPPLLRITFVGAGQWVGECWHQVLFKMTFLGPIIDI